MRQPRDIDAELKALAEKAKGLKAKRIMQLGELVTIAGADVLDHGTLAGALLSAVAEKSATTKEAWRREGQSFFQNRSRNPKGRASRSTGEADGHNASAASNGGGDETGGDRAGA